MMSFIVNLLALALMGFIVWWFWVSRAKVQQVKGSEPIEIIVKDGVYAPSNIEVAQGARVTLNFTRLDPGPCAEKVVFSELGTTLDLPLGERQTLVLEPLTPGEYHFSCQMQMYRGSLIVK